MSDSIYPPGFSLTVRDSVFHMVIIQSFGDGIYTGIFLLTVYNIFFGGKINRLGWSASLVVIPLYIFGIIHLGIHWWLAWHSFVVKADTPDDALTTFIQQPEWLAAISVTSFYSMALIADFVTIWRCWTVWNRNWKVVFVPLLLVITGVAFCIMAAVFQVDPSNLTLAARHRFAKFTAVYFCLSLASTLISTFLIVYRIVTVSRETDFHSQSSYRKVVEIVVESAALYSLILIIYVPFLVHSNFNDGYAQAILVCVMGIAPTLIFFRVSIGVSRDYSTIGTANGLSSLFAAAQGTTTNTRESRIIGNDDSSYELNLRRTEEQKYQA